MKPQKRGDSRCSKRELLERIIVLEKAVKALQKAKAKKALKVTAKPEEVSKAPIGME